MRSCSSLFQFLLEDPHSALNKKKAIEKSYICFKLEDVFVM